MKTIFLLRHAKSSWDDDSLSDHDRPLSERGRAAAPRMGAYMRGAGYLPDLVLCSTSMRTRQTLDAVISELGVEPATEFQEELYLAVGARYGGGGTHGGPQPRDGYAGRRSLW